VLGSVTLTTRRTEADGRQHVYLMHAGSLSTLLTRPAAGAATVVGRARIWDVTTLLPRLVDLFATVRMTMTDLGEPGRSLDRVGLTVWDARGALWFSSAWDGSRTVEQPIAIGNVQVR